MSERAVHAGPPAAPARRWVTPLTWRILLVAARVLIVPVCRLRVTGELAPDLRSGPTILAVNHIGPFDPVAITAACRVMRIAPRLMATGGLFRAPIVGSVMRAAGHIRVNRRQADVADALGHVIDALAGHALVLGYPEGRITLDPGMWPERGKTGLARVALRTGAPVVPVAQWGAHEVMAWGGAGAMVATLLRSLVRRPVVRVHFGPPVDLSDLTGTRLTGTRLTGTRLTGTGLSGTRLTETTPGAAQRATDRIIDAITAELKALRPDEPRLPRYIDPRRPISVQRSHR